MRKGILAAGKTTSENRPPRVGLGLTALLATLESEFTFAGYLKTQTTEVDLQSTFLAEVEPRFSLRGDQDATSVVCRREGARRGRNLK